MISNSWSNKQTQESQFFDDDCLPNSKCEDCGSALRNNVAEGTLVCSNDNCCLVHQAGLIDQTKEIRVFAPTETSN